MITRPRSAFWPSILASALITVMTVSWAEAALLNGIDCETTENDGELLQCAGRDLANNQKRLDDLVSQTLAALPVPARPLFDQANKAWVSYRDAACQWNAYDMNSGKSLPLIRATCLADLTSARVEEMESGLGPIAGIAAPNTNRPATATPSTTTPATMAAPVPAKP